MFLRLNDLKVITDKTLMKEHKKLGFSLGLSLFFHIGLVFFLMIWESDREKFKKPLVEVEWVEFILPKVDNAEQIQIVDQEKNTNRMIPEKDYRLSQSHQDILKETKTKKKGSFRNAKNKQGNPLESQRIKAKKSDQVSLNDLKPGFFGPKAIIKETLPRKTGKLNHFRSRLINISMALEEQTSPSNIEVNQNDDYLKDIALGSRTLLRTKEFVYYSYYSRIKKKLQQYWEPKVKIRIIKALGKGREIASVNDRITRLVIILNRSGELTGIRVLSSSGSSDLDGAAIEAFREASPFPNPPIGLANESGEVKINWDFVLET